MKKLHLFLIVISFTLTGCGNSDEILFSDEKIVAFANKKYVKEKNKISYVEEGHTYETVYPCTNDLEVAKSIIRPRIYYLPIIFTVTDDYFVATHKSSSRLVETRVFKCNIIKDLHIDKEKYSYEKDGVEDATYTKKNTNHDNYVGTLLERPITKEVVQGTLVDFFKFSFPSVGSFSRKIMDTSIEENKDYIQYNIYSVRKYRLAKIGIYTSYTLHKTEYQINKESGEIKFYIKELKKIKRDWF